MLLAFCVVGCFFYDVEVQVVKSGKRHRRRGGRMGGRFVIEGPRTRMQQSTPLLRKPPPLAAAPAAATDWDWWGTGGSDDNAVADGSHQSFGSHESDPWQV